MPFNLLDATTKVRPLNPAVWIEPKTEIHFLNVPGGRFLMGTEELSVRERPVHPVEISTFWIAEIPVTNQQYSVFVHETGRRPPRAWSDLRFSEPYQPVVEVSWEDVTAFCIWLSETSEMRITLPSEAQWEYAARGSDNRRYPWGDEPKPTRALACYASGNRPARTGTAGAFEKGKGPFGARDQAGNVWEWCRDNWDANAYAKRVNLGEAKDPVVTEGHRGFRVIRGGSWFNGAHTLHTAFRSRFSLLSVSDVNLGFRPICIPGEPSPR